MPEGFYGGGTPWTFDEGRTCADCPTPLPDSTDRVGNFSPRCAPCRATFKEQQQAGYKNRPDRHKTLSRKRVMPREKPPPTPKAKARAAAADPWKEALIAAIEAEGIGVHVGLVRLNVSLPAYEKQRARDPQFRARMDAAKLKGRGIDPNVALPAAHFGEFAAKYFHRVHNAAQLMLADTIDQLDAREVVMVLMAPETGKTATLEDYMNRLVALDPSHRFRIVSEAADLSTRIVGTCSRRFTDTDTYPDFIARYGPFYEKGQERAQGKPWTASQITVWKNPGTERDRNIVAQSWSGANYGSRIDTLILDDIISQRNVGQSKEIFERIRGTFFNRGISMRTIIVGTRIAPGDIYDMFHEAGLVSRTIVIPATGSLGAQPGYPSTPEMWTERLRHNGTACCPPGIGRECPRNGEWLTPKEFLDLIRFQSGENTWWASYMQNPRDDAVSTFGEALEECKDDRTYGSVDGGLNVLAIDPALGGGTALVAANLSTDRLMVLDAYTVRGLARTEQQIELIAQYARRYRPAILIVEYDAQQKGLGNDERLRILGKQLGFTIVPHTTRGQKFDVPYAVASMNQSFMKREVKIPWGDDDTRQKMEVLVHQLRGWRIPEKGKRDSQVQDLVMALWFIWRYWMQTRGVADQKFARAKRPSWLMHDPVRSPRAVPVS